MAGPNPEAFACIANELTKRGFSAPNIIAADLDKGFMLLEDLGVGVYAKLIEKDPGKERKLYESAIDTLAAIYRSTFPRKLTFQTYHWTLRDYDNAALLAETDLCLDWFSKDFNRNISGDIREEFYALYADSFKYLLSLIHI